MWGCAWLTLVQALKFVRSTLRLWMTSKSSLPLFSASHASNFCIALDRRSLTPQGRFAFQLPKMRMHWNSLLPWVKASVSSAGCCGLTLNVQSPTDITSPCNPQQSGNGLPKLRLWGFARLRVSAEKILTHIAKQVWEFLRSL